MICRRGHVGLQPGQLVDPVRQRVEHLRVVEPLRGGQVPLPAGDRVQVGQGLGQAAEFVLQHHLHLRVRQARGTPVHPVAELGRHVERLGVAGQLILVDQPGQVLVDHVVRRPDGPARLQPVEEDLGERGQVPGMEPRLARPGLQGGELADQVTPAGQRLVVAGVGVGQRERGHQVPGGVPAHLGAGLLPASARLRRRRQAVVQPERAEHPVEVEEQQVRGVPALIGQERAVEQFHVVQRQRGGAPRRAVRRVAARDRLGVGRAGQLRAEGARAGPERGAVQQGLLGDEGASAEHHQRLAPGQALRARRSARLFHVRDPLPGHRPAVIVPSDPLGDNDRDPRLVLGAEGQLLPPALRARRSLSRNRRRAVVVGSGQCSRQPLINEP